MVFVDNCYGEFVEDREPCHVGADLIAGSLIKNPGGTIAKSGEVISGDIFSGSRCLCWPARRVLVKCHRAAVLGESLDVSPGAVRLMPYNPRIHSQPSGASVRVFPAGQCWLALE